MRRLHEVFRTNLVLVVAGVGAGTACVPEGNAVGSTTKPGETVLTMSRGPALGWCPYENMLLDVTVARDVDGRYILSGSKTVESTDPAANCTFSDRDFIPPCFVSVPLAPTVLADQDAVNLERLLARLPSRVCGGSFFIICDPCRVTQLAFADRTERSCCMGGTAYDRVFGDIETLLDAIASEE